MCLSGGASREETDSGLFVYRTEPFFHESSEGNDVSAAFPIWNDEALQMEYGRVEDVLRRPRIVMQVSILPISALSVAVNDRLRVIM